MSGPLRTGLAAVRIRVLDDDEVELCDVEGCITIFHRSPTHRDRSHGDTPQLDPQPGGETEPPWVEAPLRYVSGYPALYQVTTNEAENLAIIDPTRGGEESDLIKVQSLDRIIAFKRCGAITTDELAEAAPNLMLDRVIHVIAVGNRIRLGGLKPLRSSLGDTGEIAITMVRVADE